MTRRTAPPALGLGPSLGIFAAAGVLLYLATHHVIPALARATGAEPVLFWFLVGGLGVFGPLVGLGVIMLRREPVHRPAPSSGSGRWAPWAARLRLRRMDRGDWGWALGGLVVVAILSGAVQLLLLTFADDPVLSPPFLTFEPLGPGRYWILAAWVPFWLLNILGEEFLWRGVLLPRQEAAMGGMAWMANAGGWALFHVALGLI